MPLNRRWWIPGAAGLLGGIGLAGLYVGIVSIAESPAHAVDLFLEDWWIVLPIILGFSIQVSLYTILRLGYFLPAGASGATGALTGTSGGVSATAMVACCAHHVTDVLPLLGLTAAATFLAEYRLAFMLVGLGTTVVGIAVMLTILLRERRKALYVLATAQEVV